MHVQMAGTDWIFLNSSKAVNDLMEKRSAKYSGRAISPMVGDTISGNYRLVVQDYGQMWREGRKVMNMALNGAMADKFKPMSDIETRQTMYELLVKPEEWYLHFIRFTASCQCHPGLDTR